MALYRTLIGACLLGIALLAVALGRGAYDPSFPATYGGYYVRVLIFNVLFLAAALWQRRRLMALLDAARAWLRQPTDRYPRLVVASLVTMIVVAYLARAHLGFWFYGISGWTYRTWATRLSESPITLPVGESQRPATERELKALQAAVVPANAAYLPGPGYLGGPAMLLHYADGTILPGNEELTDTVFPGLVFGPSYGRQDHPDRLVRVVRDTLSRRRAGDRFLLPERWSYPNHSVYMPLSYTTHPPAATLKRITMWTIVAAVSPESGGAVRVVEAVCRDDIRVD